jgi:competence ComEA-like helix-hairpin-helix protein
MNKRREVRAVILRERRQRDGVLLASALLTGAAFVLSQIAPSEAELGSSLEIPMHRVDLSTASVRELALLEGVGPSLAHAIEEHRLKHGPFASFKSLEDVKGIGARTREGFESEVILGGGGEDASSIRGDRG